MKPQGPCKGCKDRTAENPEAGTHDCHNGCDRYREYRKKLLEYNRKVYNAQAAEAYGGRSWMKKGSRAQREYEKEVNRDRKR